jgi:methylthioribose-1-phosphate isomerase
LWQPAALIDGLITEHGIITKPPGASGFDVAAFVSKHKQR